MRTLSFQVIVDDGQIQIIKLHPEGPLEDFFDTEAIESSEILEAINYLSTYEFHKQKRKEEFRDKEIEKEKARSRAYIDTGRITNGLPKSQGIYVIKCSGNNKVYVGASKNIKARVKTHVYQMTADDSSHPLAECISDFGIESITAEVVELVDNREELSKREQHWIEEFDSIDNGYNKIKSNGHFSWQDSEVVENE